MATSRLSAPSCLATAPCEPRAPYSFLRTNAAANRNKKATYFIYVSKVRWKEGRKEGAGRITLSAGWYHSIRPDQFSQTEGDESGAGTRRREGVKERELKWWSYWFVKEIQRCVFCLNVHINLSCQRWAGVCWHLATQIGHIDCGFSACCSYAQSYLLPSCGNQQSTSTCSELSCMKNYLV